MTETIVDKWIRFDKIEENDQNEYEFSWYWTKNHVWTEAIAPSHQTTSVRKGSRESTKKDYEEKMLC